MKCSESIQYRQMQPLHLSAFAGIVLTNDGNAILREIDVTHPAAKVGFDYLLLHLLLRVSDKSCSISQLPDL